MPGESSAMVTALDGHEIARRGAGRRRDRVLRRGHGVVVVAGAEGEAGVRAPCHIK
ncbi:hypothetical protein [Microtetraspora malaysiensis]|uniref:Uncharacterized protein n=1 Tax=Microtetraspora malaysiensis TaxID=161358 RepID=A0ABW6T334_9ACTN